MRSCRAGVCSRGARRVDIEVREAQQGEIQWRAIYGNATRTKADNRGWKGSKEELKLLAAAIYLAEFEGCFVDFLCGALLFGDLIRIVIVMVWCSTWLDGKLHPCPRLVQGRRRLPLWQTPRRLTAALLIIRGSRCQTSGTKKDGRVNRPSRTCTSCSCSCSWSTQAGMEAIEKTDQSSTHVFLNSTG